MSAAVCLLLFSLAVAVFAPALLRTLTRDGHAPRWGVAAWLAAIGSVVFAWLAAIVEVFNDVVTHWNEPVALAASCLHQIHRLFGGHIGPWSKEVLLLAAATAAGAAAVSGVVWIRSMMRVSSRSHEHAQAVRLVGRNTGETDVVVIDAAERAAYCVTGRPSAIVVTSGALAVLDEHELSAVLAHERAHLAGHHAKVVAALRSLATTLPFVPLFTHAAAEVPRLLEMCADDAAVRRHGHPALLAGLVALAGATPVAALGAADLAVMSRVSRLVTPSHVSTRFLVRTALAGAVGGPVSGALAMILTGAFGCGS